MNKPAKKAPRKPAAKGFTSAEREAMQERVREMKGEGAGEADVLAKIAALPEPDRALAQRLHALVTSSAPNLSPKTWYGMPAYAKDDKVVCFFQSAHKFKTRYATFGFSAAAKLDDGDMWPVSFALMKLTTAEETKIRALLKKALA